MFGLIVCALISSIAILLLSLFGILDDYPFWVKLIPLMLIMLRMLNSLALKINKRMAIAIIASNVSLLSADEKIMFLSSPAIFLTPTYSKTLVTRNELSAQNTYITFIAIAYFIASLIWHEDGVHVILMIAALSTWLICIPFRLGFAFYTDGFEPELGVDQNAITAVTNYLHANGESFKEISKTLFPEMKLRLCFSLFQSVSYKIQNIDLFIPSKPESLSLIDGESNPVANLAQTSAAAHESQYPQQNRKASHHQASLRKSLPHKAPHWYYLAPDGMASGPYFKTALLALIEDGMLTWDTYVWNGTPVEDGGKWVLARDARLHQ
jgi:hypothetical protein